MMMRGMTPKKKKILSVPLPPEDRIFLLPINLGVGRGGIKDGCCKERRRRKVSLFRFSRFLLFPNGKKGGGELSREAGDRRRMLCFFFSFPPRHRLLSSLFFSQRRPNEFHPRKMFRKR